MGARYYFELPLIFKCYSQEVTFGYDFRRTNNFLSFAGSMLYDNYIDISNFVIRYEGKVSGEFFNTGFGFTNYISPGNMSRYNKDKYYAVERTGAKCNFWFGLFNIDTVVALPKNYSWVMSCLAQVASGKLLPSQQMSLGGHITVRGYKENEVIGDRGVLLKNELRTCPIKFLSGKFQSQLQFLGFVDFGYANQIDQNIMNRNSAILTSVGPGLRLNYKDVVTVVCDYGIQLKEVHGRYFNQGMVSKFYTSVFVSF